MGYYPIFYPYNLSLNNEYGIKFLMKVLSKGGGGAVVFHQPPLHQLLPWAGLGCLTGGVVQRRPGLGSGTLLE